MSLSRLFIMSWVGFMLCIPSYTIAAPSTSVATNESITAQQITSDVVNINNADLQQLETLKGIGAAKAQAILDYRAQHGPFKSIEELHSVKGISEKILENLLRNNPNRMIVE